MDDLKALFVFLCNFGGADCSCRGDYDIKWLALGFPIVGHVYLKQRLYKQESCVAGAQAI